MRTPARTLPHTACRPHVRLFNDMSMPNSVTLGGGGCGVCGQTSPHLRCCHAWLPGCHPALASATQPGSRLLPPCLAVPPWPKLLPPGCYLARLQLPRPSHLAAATLPYLAAAGHPAPATATRLLPPCLAAATLAQAAATRLLPCPGISHPAPATWLLRPCSSCSHLAAAGHPAHPAAPTLPQLLPGCCCHPALQAAATLPRLLPSY
jgi:hypothetical protein